MNPRTFVPVLGGVLGMALAAWLVVYIPMSANYAECGKVTLCKQERPCR